MGEVLDDGEKEYRYLLAAKRLKAQESAERWAPFWVALYILWIPLLALYMTFIYRP